ncbi:MAG: hypothetical protein ACLUJG_16150 [Lawsonibacter sp.]
MEAVTDSCRRASQLALFRASASRPGDPLLQRGRRSPSKLHQIVRVPALELPLPGYGLDAGDVLSGQQGQHAGSRRAPVSPRAVLQAAHGGFTPDRSST